MVALLRLRDPRQMRRQLGRLEERGPVDALHRLVPRVALPVGVGAVEHLERLQPPRRGDVRSGAEVDEGVLDRVARDDRAAFLLDQLHLERLAAAVEEGLGLGLRHHLPLVAQILLRQLAHLALDGLEVLRDERAVDDEVVEEPVVYRRPDAALRLREQRGHRGGQQVRGAVAVERERLGGVRGDEPHRGVAVEGVRQIDHPPVDDGGQGLSGQTRRDAGGHLGHRRARGRGAGRAVRQGDGDLTHAASADRPAALENLVGTGGLEPPTSCMSSRRSDQLSYAPISRGEWTLQAMERTGSIATGRKSRQRASRGYAASAAACSASSSTARSSTASSAGSGSPSSGRRTATGTCGSMPNGWIDSPEPVR